MADALLGAAGLGDIGEHYPDTDPRWNGLDSSRLLAEVVDRVAAAGWRPVNCDVIIHAQEPKLGPHKPAIRANLARLLGLDRAARQRQGQDRRARRPDRPRRGDRLRGRRPRSSRVPEIGDRPGVDASIQRSDLRSRDQDPCRCESITR